MPRVSSAVAHDACRSPSTSTISSGFSAAWSEEPKQRQLFKQTSLPIPALATDSTLLPSARGTRLPKAQVFVTRPATPKPEAMVTSSTVSSIRESSISKNRAQNQIRSVSDFQATRQAPVRRPYEDFASRAVDGFACPARSATPAPDQWRRNGNNAFDVLDDESVGFLKEDPDAFYSSQNRSRLVEPYERYSETRSESDTSERSVDNDRQTMPEGRLLSSLRQLNFRRNRQKEDIWHGSGMQCAPPSLTERLRFSSPSMASNRQEKATRLLSFDPYRQARNKTSQPAAQRNPFRPKRRPSITRPANATPFDHIYERPQVNARNYNEACHMGMDGGRHVSMQADDYVGFMITPPKGPVGKRKGRSWWSRVFRRDRY